MAMKKFKVEVYVNIPSATAPEYHKERVEGTDIEMVMRRYENKDVIRIYHTDGKGVTNIYVPHIVQIRIREEN